MATSSILATPTRYAALSHLQLYMRVLELQNLVPPRLFMSEYIRRYNLLFGAISAMYSSRTVDSVAVPRLSYAAVAEFLPLLYTIMQRHSPRGPCCNAEVYTAVYPLLIELFCCGEDSVNNDGAVDDAVAMQRRGDIAHFVASEDFEPLLNLEKERHQFRLQKFLGILDDDAFACAFTDRRVDHILAQIELHGDLSSSVATKWFFGILTTLVVRIPGFAHRFIHANAFTKILSSCEDVCIYKSLFGIFQLQRNVAFLLDSILSLTADLPHVAERLLECGAMKTCCTLLTYFVLANREHERRIDALPSGADQPGLLLRVLRKMISSVSRVGSENPFVTELITNRGLQALELLRYDDCLQEIAGADSQQELGQLRALLAGMGVLAPDTAATEELHLTTVRDVRTFAQPHNDWQKAFDAHIACALEESGCPRPIARYDHRHVCRPVPAATRENGPPSAAALSLLQARARECVLLNAREQAEHIGTSASDVVFQLGVVTTGPQVVSYSLGIRLQDNVFPCNSAHFRLAAKSKVLGSELHTCFVPPGLSRPASLPFVTLWAGKYQGSGASCASTPVSLPESNIVYGENTTPTSGAGTAEHYPVGTVLMFPGTYTPRWSDNLVGAGGLLWFITYKPCPVSLLRGAVPVGRVMSCVEGSVPANHDSGDEPFNSALLQCFEARCEKKCNIGAQTTKVSVVHQSFRPM